MALDKNVQCLLPFCIVSNGNQNSHLKTTHKQVFRCRISGLWEIDGLVEVGGVNSVGGLVGVLREEE